MRRRFLLLALPAFLAGAAVMVASATSLTVSPKKVAAIKSCVLTGYPKAALGNAETYADQLNPTKKSGSATTLIVSNRSLRNRFAYIRFDLGKCSPAIANTATVQLATLSLYITAQAASSRTYGAYLIDGSSCPEGLTTCWSEANLSYNNRPGTASAATATVTVNTGAANNNKYYSWVVTTDVAKFVAGTAINYGWRISDPNSDLGVLDATFATTDADNATHAPVLTVVYRP